MAKILLIKPELSENTSKSLPEQGPRKYSLQEFFAKEPSPERMEVLTQTHAPESNDDAETGPSKSKKSIDWRKQNWQ